VTIENESTGTETVAADSTSQVASEPTASQDSSPVGGESAESAEVKAAPSYVPNLKFKANGKEMEFEPWAHAIVKDAETEEKIREFHAKAYGIEQIKADRAKLKQDISSMKNEYGSLQARVNGVMTAVKNKDYDTAFESLGLNDQDILRHAKNILDRMNNPQLAQHHQQQRQYQQQLEQAQHQNQQYQQQYIDASVQAKTFELNQMLSRPDVKEIADAFDEARGQGSFYEEVIRRGQYHHYTSGADISAEQAVNEVLALLGPGYKRQAQQQVQPQVQSAVAQQQVAETPQVAPKAAKPVIPNIQGRGTSPTKKVPKSIDDLIAIRKEMEARAQ
jgi:hypothetical protein